MKAVEQNKRGEVCFSASNAEQALIHKLEGGDTPTERTTTTVTAVNEHDSIGRMAGEVRDKAATAAAVGEVRRLAARAKRDAQQSGLPAAPLINFRE